MRKYDVVIVGAGNAALCAAISAKENGASVLVLEKGPEHKRGGNSFFTDGAIRTAYNDLDAIRKIIPNLSDEEAAQLVMPEYSAEDYYQDLIRVTEGQCQPELAKQLVSKSYETIVWMRDQGVEFELNYDNQSFKKEDKIHFWGGLPVKTKEKGIGLMKALFNRAKEVGIDIWYEAQATELLTTDDKISGIVVKGEKETIVDTKSVVLACGSFEANKEMRSRHLGPEWEAAIVRGTEFNTGDGLKMATEIGAQPYGEWAGCHSIGTDANVPKVGDFTKPGDIFKKHSYPLGIMLNKDGFRFVDEGADFRNYTYAKYGREILKQPGNIAYQIFDNQVRPFLRKEYNLPEATALEADTLEELVEKLPVNKEQFLQTIKEYNEAVQDGKYNPSIKDGKSTKGISPEKTNWALPIKEGPFYAFPVTCGITFAFGGIHVTTNGEVLNQNQKPVQGLFAAGEMVGGLFYKNYPGGSGLMSGSVYGRISGKQAAKYAVPTTIN